MERKDLPNTTCSLENIVKVIILEVCGFTYVISIHYRPQMINHKNKQSCLTVGLRVACMINKRNGCDSAALCDPT